MHSKRVQEQIFDTGRAIQKSMCSSPQAGYTRTFAMQPIIDRSKELFAFEALYRSGFQDSFTGDPHIATRTMAMNWADYALQSIAGDARVFFNCTQQSLEEGIASVLPSTIVLELLEDVVVTDELLHICVNLQSSGFQISLDDFEYSPEMDDLARIADYVKIDFRRSHHAERKQLVQRLRCNEARLIAEKVETRDEYEEALDLGFDLFQGFYIARPMLISRSSVVTRM